jgi:DNA helicase-2/ATP-dependent DNA helicase PcrA
MTRLVSDHFRNPPAGLTTIYHTAAVEMEAAILGAEIVSFLMQPDMDGNHFETFIHLLCNYYHGKGGVEPTKTDLKEALAIRKASIDYHDRQIMGSAIRKTSIMVEILKTYTKTRKAVLAGNPERDWLIIRDILEKGKCPRLKSIAQEVRNIRLLERGTQLRQALAQDWRDTGAYTSALAITRQEFVREHFSTNHKPENGVVIMNMHKAKGKQFDEVIIFEGWPIIVKRKIIANPDRIVWSNIWENADNQARQNFRVSVTRARLQTTILTPKNDPCILLLNKK